MRRVRVRLSLRITITFAVGALLVSSAVSLSAYLFTKRFLVNEQERTTLRQTYQNASVVRDLLLGESAEVPDVLDQVATSSATRAVIHRAGRWYSSWKSVV